MVLEARWFTAGRISLIAAEAPLSLMPFLAVAKWSPELAPGTGPALNDTLAMAPAGGPKVSGSIRSTATVLDGRANADGFLRALDDATDRYVLVCSAYLQNRADLVRQARGLAQVLPDFDAARIEP